MKETITIEATNSEEFKLFMRRLWHQVAVTRKPLSIEVDDRVYLRQRLFEFRREEGEWEDISIIFPKQSTELWIVPQELEAEINGKSGRRALKKGDFKLV